MNAGKAADDDGEPEDNDTAGLLPRSLGAILARPRIAVRGAAELPRMRNEHVYDLMAPTGRWAKRRALRVRSVTTRIEVANLTSTKVTSAARVGARRAAQSKEDVEDGLNQTSSRSHHL